MSKNLPDTHEATRFIPLREVTRRYGRSRWWVRDEIQAGRFPLPVMLGDRPAFVEAEIEQHQRNLMARRGNTSLAGSHDDPEINRPNAETQAQNPTALSRTPRAITRVRARATQRRRAAGAAITGDTVIEAPAIAAPAEPAAPRKKTFCEIIDGDDIPFAWAVALPFATLFAGTMA